MSECSKYQLLLQTVYVRLKEKYDHLYIYSHIYYLRKRKTNTQVTLILFDWKTSESFIYRTYEDWL